MTDILHSIAIEGTTKRVPKSRQGQVLVFMRNQIINELKSQVKQDKAYIPSDKVARVVQLNKNIKAKIIREDLKHKRQTQLAFGLSTFQVSYVRPGQKRVRIEEVDACDVKQARATIRKRWGKGTKINNVK